jgi:hypothetical protein
LLVVREETVSAREAPATATCAACGAPVQPDQEWCVECGTARTVLHGPPDWRAPLAVIAIVVGVVLVAGLIAIVALTR